ncbi:MAG: CDC48 family AAA ATPase [Candidatus Verstraetearchaeota archaeon]|nr:CDC48 family AAA ATPase [Candidatus Verstraetearchaeota archaeon]
MTGKQTIELEVAEARTRDVGRALARLNRRTMGTLSLRPGDFIELEGKRKTVAIAWPAYSEDEDHEIIRIDGIIRHNTGTSIGDSVRVSKVDIKPVSKLVLAPTEPIRFSSDFGVYVRQILQDKPLSKGDTVLVPILGEALRLVVASIQPEPSGFVTEETEVVVKEEPVKEVDTSRPKVSYEDIGGLEDAKEKIREMIELPMRHPELFKHLGIEPPKGILMYGPPGCGKTLLAKAVANESGANFISINGPEIMSKFYGESEQKLREIFEEAEKNAPSIIFIDEIDSIAPKREEVTGEVERRVVAQLLSLMDGLKSRGQVIVIAATNRPDAIDPALRRPGRFDRELAISMPDKKARQEILQVHVRGMPLSEDVNIEEIAGMTHGHSGADLAALCREAAMRALRRFLPKLDLQKQTIPASILSALKVSKADFLEAMREITPSALREVYVEVPEVHWDDVGGLEEVKRQLREMVEWPLKHPELFEQMGIEPPKGILMYGPPGTGKTLLAKAVATESQANFISVKGPEVLSKWVGESEKAIREIFKKARQAAPCIVFFDELDSIAPRRGEQHDSGVTERMVNQILSEMDGLVSLKNVVVIGATNRPELIDPALLRPGRFDRSVYIPLPDRAAREAILKVHTRKMPLDGGVDLKALADKTEGYSGADLAALCREAALSALREDMKPKKIQMRHFEEALKAVHPSVSREDMLRYNDSRKVLGKMFV